MGRTSTTEPSPFWNRLVEAWAAKGLPTSQNGVAERLGMTGNGSTGRWYRGAGLPETDTLKRIAKLGNVTIDWLLDGNQPKTPISPGSELYQLLEMWEQLQPDNRSLVLRSARAELALQHEKEAEEPRRRTPSQASR